MLQSAIINYTLCVDDMTLINNTMSVKNISSKPSLFFLFIFNIICTHSLHCLDGFGFGKPDYSNIFGNSRSFGIDFSTRSTDYFSKPDRLTSDTFSIREALTSPKEDFYSNTNSNRLTVDNAVSFLSSSRTKAPIELLDKLVCSNYKTPIDRHIEKTLGIDRYSNATSYQHESIGKKSHSNLEGRISHKEIQETKSIKVSKPNASISKRTDAKAFSKGIAHNRELQNLYTKQLNTNGVNLSKNITINQNNSTYHYHDDGNTFDNRFKQKSIFNHKKSEPWSIKFGRSRNTRQDYISQNNDITSCNHQKTINNQLDKSDKKEESYVISDLVHQIQQNKSRELEERYSIKELAILNNPDSYDYFDQRKIDKLSRGIKNLIDQQFDVESLTKLDITSNIKFDNIKDDIDYIKSFAKESGNFVAKVVSELTLYSNFLEALEKGSIDAFDFLLSAIEVRNMLLGALELSSCFGTGGLSFCLNGTKFLKAISLYSLDAIIDLVLEHKSEQLAKWIAGNNTRLRSLFERSFNLFHRAYSGKLSGKIGKAFSNSLMMKRHGNSGGGKKGLGGGSGKAKENKNQHKTKEEKNQERIAAQKRAGKFASDKEAAEEAKKLGLIKHKKKIDVKGTKLLCFSDKKEKMFYTRDIDGHSGGAWKGAKSKKDLQNRENCDTYDRKLNWVKE